MNEAIALSCTGLKKTFDDGILQVEVLQGIDLAIRQGDCLAIVGSSGSGKSTLLHLLGGLDRPTAGQVTVAGRVMSELTEQEQGRLRNYHLGFVYQFHHLLSEFTALENVAIPLLVRGTDAAAAASAATVILEKVGLGKRLQHKPGELSGGERQRTAIARALVTSPQCILADEPTGNLDEHTATQVFDVMMDLNRESNVSLVMVTHNMKLAGRFEKVQLLHEGRLEDFRAAALV
jgi:lipoprotein-releasing system ATP-binding protein